MSSLVIDVEISGRSYKGITNGQVVTFVNGGVHTVFSGTAFNLWEGVRQSVLRTESLELLGLDLKSQPCHLLVL